MQRFTVFGRPDCGYCVRAKQLLDKKDFNYRWIDINVEGISKADLAPVKKEGEEGVEDRP